MKNNSDFLTVATPAPWDRGAPVINGPVLWGATPGRELLYALPVRGERPLHFEWSGEIPPGLRLDPDRGFVTGRAPAGIYRLRFLVSNRLGRAEKPFRFEIAPNRLCRTPLLGWSSWNACVDLVTQEAVAEAAMQALYLEYSPVTAQVIVLDPQTFEVLAMAEAPSYDLNDVPRDDPALLNALSRNNLVSDIYEPGSTFKIVTAAANIEEYFRGNPAAFSPQHVFDGSRTRTVDGTTIRCWSDHKNGKHAGQTLAEALNNSCNPCFTDIALALGTETFYEYLSAFGFGKGTGIDFSGEAQGMLLPESAVRLCDLARIGFGQTVAVTAVQLACAAASAVNGGSYMRPRLVRRLLSADGRIEEEFPSVLVGRTVSERTSRLLAQLLEGVVANGSGSRAYIEGYKVAGKTGTAQKFENGAIAQGKYVSSFLGFFPSDDPRYLALVIVDEPVGAYYGSVVAAPAAREIFEGIIKVKGIEPVE